MHLVPSRAVLGAIVESLDVSQPGDLVEVVNEAIGVLANRVVAG